MFKSYRVEQDEFDMTITYYPHTACQQCVALSEEAKAVVETIAGQILMPCDEKNKTPQG